ncbi:MAG: PHB depolymerase family esterase [Anaerolineae bacterium]
MTYRWWDEREDDRAAEQAGPLSEGTQRHYLFAGGAVRSYCVHLPAAYRQGGPLPLVLSLHGIAADAGQQERLSGLSNKAEEAGFIAVYPEALGAPPRWEIGAGEEAAGDLVFLRALLDHLYAALNVDRRRLIVTGFSNGAGMANRMACALAGRIAAVGLVAGAYPAWNGCHPARPVPVVAFHGSADRVVPYEGLGAALPPIRKWAAGWARRNRCHPQPSITYREGCVIGETWHDAAGRAMVTLYTIKGGGHTWPGSPLSLALPGLPPDFAATDLIWAFACKQMQTQPALNGSAA